MKNKSESKPKKHKKSKRKSGTPTSEDGYLVDWDEHFAFIAGYTEGGVPFGVTWEEYVDIEPPPPQFTGPRRDFLMEPVKLSEVVGGLEIHAEADYRHCYLDTRRSLVVCVSETDFEIVESEGSLDPADIPNYHDDGIAVAREIFVNYDGRYLELPDRDEIDAYGIMWTFIYDIKDKAVRVHMLRDLDDKRVFRRFNDNLHRYHLTDQYWRYRIDRLKPIAIQWCEREDIPIVDDMAKK